MNETANRFPPKNALAISGLGLQKAPDEVRCGFENDHNEDENFLQAHVQDLSPGLGCINMEDIRTF